MWKAKISVYDETGLFATLAKKHNITIQGYMLNYFSRRNHFYFTLIVFLNFNDKIRKNFITDISQAKRVDKFEDQGNFLICELKIPNRLEKERKPSLFYNPELIQIAPFVITPDGWEELEFASFERKHLENVLKISEKAYNLKLHYLKEEKVENFGIISALPLLTEKQRNTLNIAIENGYYEYPRKTDVKKLSKKNKISFSTFQEHLRKAENKLINFIYKKSK